MWSVTKHCVVKILQGIWERFLYENNRNYNSYKFSYKFTFIPCLSFHRNQKQASNFQQVGDLVTRNISVFCLQWVVLYFKGMTNSIDFYKRISLHVIPIRIKFPCYYNRSQQNMKSFKNQKMCWSKLYKKKGIF